MHVVGERRCASRVMLATPVRINCCQVVKTVKTMHLLVYNDRSDGSEKYVDQPASY